MFGNLIFKIKMKRKVKTLYPDGVILRSSEMEKSGRMFSKENLEACYSPGEYMDQERLAVITLKNMNRIIRLLYGSGLPETIKDIEDFLRR